MVGNCYNGMNNTFALHKLSHMLLKRTSPAILLLVTMLLPAELSAQVPAPVAVEISTQKIVAEGKVYYMHQVVKGQTLYSISKAYNVTVDQLTSNNEIPPNGIKEGQMLKVPANAAATASAAATPANQDERFLYHKVKRGETLSSVAGEYGISVRDLKKANKGLLFPHEGDYLMIPRKKITGQPPEKKPLPDTVTVPEELRDTLIVAGEKEIFTKLSENTVLKDLQRLCQSCRDAPVFHK